MLPVFLVTFPFFALIAAGYGAARARILPLDAIPGLNSFVLYFALPCMLLRFGAGTPIGQLLDGSVALVWGLSALAVVGGVVAFTRNARIGWNDAAFGALVAAFPNTGFMGVPLLVAILGAQAAGPMIITIAFDLVVTSSLCIALSRLDGAGPGAAHHGPRQAARQALRGILVNPMPWSILLGVLLSAARWKLPGPVERTVAMLADAASPVALFTIGAVLARSVQRSTRPCFSRWALNSEWMRRCVASWPMKPRTSVRYLSCVSGGRVATASRTASMKNCSPKGKLIDRALKKAVENASPPHQSRANGAWRSIRRRRTTSSVLMKTILVNRNGGGKGAWYRCVPQCLHGAFGCLVLSSTKA